MSKFSSGGAKRREALRATLRVLVASLTSPPGWPIRHPPLRRLYGTRQPGRQPRATDLGILPRDAETCDFFPATIELKHELCGSRGEGSSSCSGTYGFGQRATGAFERDSGGHKL